MVAVKKILVTGAGGLLGSEFKALSHDLQTKDFAISPFSHSELDITRSADIEKAIHRHKPDVIINCAAYTNVDGAERETEEAHRINVSGPQILSESCLKHQIRLIHYSTDFVFSGEKRKPYIESDPPAPINAYGRTKWEGEKTIPLILPEDQYLILRISWPYGKNGKNFIHSLWELSKTRPELRVVTDQVGVPNPARLLAQKTLELSDGATGLFHLSCTGACSRYELICFLLDQIKSSCRVIPVVSEEFPLPAQRPAYSVLGTNRHDLASRLELPPWQEALTDYLAQISCK